MKSYVNLGCGSRYHPAWTNIDIVPQGPGVIQHDLSRGIPLRGGSCSVVYHAAVLEHMRGTDALAFLLECHRVLQPGGILRVGVPDLEQLCRVYQHTLEAAIAGDEAATRDYDWIMLELYDQVVREQSGGDMLAYLRQDPLLNESFVYARIGNEGRHLVQALRQQTRACTPTGSTSTKPFLRRLRKRLSRIPAAAKHRLQRWLLGADGMRALEIGRFRLCGEVHHWMYDRYSLARLLEKAGFCDPIVRDPRSSQIPEWNGFYLDTLPDGEVIKPDLFFMEAVKTGRQSRG